MHYAGDLGFPAVIFAKAPLMRYDDEVDDDDLEDELTSPDKPSHSNRWTCLILVLGIGGLSVLLLCCGGGVGLVWFGLNVVSTEIEEQLRDNPKLKEHVGVVESFTFDFTRTAALNKPDAMVFHVKGSIKEGDVTVVADTDGEGHQVVRSAVLRLPDGTDIPLVP